MTGHLRVSMAGQAVGSASPPRFYGVTAYTRSTGSAVLRTRAHRSTVLVGKTAVNGQSSLRCSAARALRPQPLCAEYDIQHGVVRTEGHVQAHVQSVRTRKQVTESRAAGGDSLVALAATD